MAGKMEFFIPPGCGCDLVEVPPETASQPNCYLVIKMCPHHASADSLKLQVSELQEDKEALIQQRDRAHRAADSQEKDLEESNRLLGEERERIAKLVEEFEEWEWTPNNPSARMDQGTTEIDTQKSLAKLAAEVRSTPEKRICDHEWQSTEPVLHFGEQCRKCLEIRPKSERK